MKAIDSKNSTAAAGQRTPARLGRRVSKEKSVKNKQAAHPNPKLNQTYEGSPSHLRLVILRFALPEKHQQRQSHAARYHK
jgi:hypothetical protein